MNLYLDDDSADRRLVFGIEYVKVTETHSA